MIKHAGSVPGKEPKAQFQNGPICKQEIKWNASLQKLEITDFAGEFIIFIQAGCFFPPPTFPLLMETEIAL